MKKILLITLLLPTLYSCKKKFIEPEYKPIIECTNPTSDILKAKSFITGKWSWAYEKYLDRFSQSYIIKTPQSEGFTRHYEFFKNGEVRIYRDQNLLETAIFEITTLNVVTGSPMDSVKTILLFKNIVTTQRINFTPMVICNNTLTLNYQAYSDTKGQEKWYKN